MPLRNNDDETGETLTSERSKRFIEEVENCLPHHNNSEIAREIGCSEGAVRLWAKGSKIDSRYLPSMHAIGMDVLYLLTGERSSGDSRVPARCQNGKLCERIPTHLRLLAEIVEASCSLDESERVVAQDALLAAAQAIQATLKSHREPDQHSA
jgi:hypothetical protein